MAFKVETTPLKGLYLIEPKVHSDARGRFVKTFQASVFKTLGLDLPVAEDFFSVSKKNALRGMHFQTPPFDHHKLVTCLHGKVLDVALDLRNNSPTFGQYMTFELSGENAKSLFLPSGFAHGFLTLSDEAWIAYKVTSEYAPAHDSGVRWDSFGFNWPVHGPIISNRDEGFQNFNPHQKYFE